MRKKILILLLSLAIVFPLAIFVVAQNITLFVVQPIGAVPEGVTLIISRMNKTKFIDNADAMCRRELGYVNLICRATALGAVANNADIHARLPYSELLYELSEK